MRIELEEQLQLDFPFMQQNRVENERNTYRRWGCQCGDGWYDLIHELCQSIAERYYHYGKTVDIVVTQIKQKFGTLRFYYGYENAPCPINAFDFPNARLSLRLIPDSDTDEQTNQLRKDIAQIVRNFEKESSTICESCGNSYEITMDRPWNRTLWDTCNHNEDKIFEEKLINLKRL